jgi:hypothetical protein
MDTIVHKDGYVNIMHVIDLHRSSPGLHTPVGDTLHLLPGLVTSPS